MSRGGVQKSTRPPPKGPKSSLKPVRGGRRHETSEALDRITIRGFKRSKAATNSDGGIHGLIGFLERKSTNPSAPAREAVRIRRHRLNGDALIISVRPEDTPKIKRLNQYTFAGATLSIEVHHKKPPEKRTPLESDADSETPHTIDVLKAVLSRRYNIESKLLDLSYLGNDPELVNIGMFSTTSRESKFFPALMKICDSIFTTPQEKEDAITSVSLANNFLTSISAVTTLSQTYPALKNLDLSNNQINNLSALASWRWKFRKLEHLILSGNPIEVEEPTYHNDILKWYPTLSFLNMIQVRSPEEAKANAQRNTSPNNTARKNTSPGTIAPKTTSSKPAARDLPFPILGPSFQDEGSISESFLKHFYSAYDGDRGSLANAFYDSQSTFSLSINTSAPRAPDSTGQKIAGWDAYIKRSRNLKKVGQLPAKTSRLHTGTDSIRDAFLSLPPTRHPDLMVEGQKWCIECHPIPYLPDPAGQAAGGVNGLMIMVHGEFSEVDVSTGQSTTMRSFDRTFVLGPGGGIGGVRVIADTLVLRSYGGHSAWQPEGVKTDVQVQQRLATELSKATGMNLEYSIQCLEQNRWNMGDAVKNFEEAKNSLPVEAFVQGL
ncbi:nuclear mRNA export, poly(A)+RNA binding protein [Mycoblastus sanguinarius]|nr:nuclear mRNA export, poly(A)+RNA binding protein [Mycoblastus sanguinarius]